MKHVWRFGEILALDSHSFTEALFTDIYFVPGTVREAQNTVMVILKAVPALLQLLGGGLLARKHAHR